MASGQVRSLDLSVFIRILLVFSFIYRWCYSLLENIFPSMFICDFDDDDKQYLVHVVISVLNVYFIL